MEHIATSLATAFTALQLFCCVLTPSTTSAQPVTNQWNMILQQKPYDLFDLGDSFALVGVNDNGQAVLETFGNNGALLQSTVLPQIEALGASYYDRASNCIYVWGADNSATKFTMARYSTDGTLAWKKDFTSTSGFRFPYQIAQLGDKIAFTFGQINNVGLVTGIGWYILDSQGNKLGEKVYPLNLNNDFAFPFASAFDPNGRLIVSLSSVSTGKCRMYSFDPDAGSLFWTKNFIFSEYNTIESVVVDDKADIYFTGEGGFFIKLSQEGDVLFNKTIGYDAYTAGRKIIFQGDAAYVIGGWRKDLDLEDLSAKMLVGKYDKNTGEERWIWDYEHDGIENGPIAMNGFFRSDSTLLVHFTRLFESDWVGAFAVSTNLSVPSRTIQALNIYPSPSYDGQIRVSHPAVENGQLRLFSENGALLFEQRYTTGQTVKVPHPGRFVVELIDGDTRAVGKAIRGK